MYSDVPDAGGKGSEEELAQLAAAFRHMPVGMVILDCELRCIRVNEALAQINGLLPEDHIGLSIFDVIPTFSVRMEAAFRQVLSSGEPLARIEVSSVAPGYSEERHFWESIAPLCDDRDGRIHWLLVSVMDVTDRIRAKQSPRAATSDSIIAPNINLLQDGIDLSTPLLGKMVLEIAAILAEANGNIIRKRSKAPSAAHARRRLGSRSPLLSPEKLDTARHLMTNTELTMAEVAARVGVSRTTLYRALMRNAPVKHYSRDI